MRVAKKGWIGDLEFGIWNLGEDCLLDERVKSYRRGAELTDFIPRFSQVYVYILLIFRYRAYNLHNICSVHAHISLAYRPYHFPDIYRPFA